MMSDLIIRGVDPFAVGPMSETEMAGHQGDRECMCRPIVYPVPVTAFGEVVGSLDLLIHRSG